MPATDYTPGPWVAHNSEHPITNSAASFVVDFYGHLVAMEIHGASPSARIANNRLIAAAPDLLAALQAMESAVTDGFTTKEARHNARKALIAARAAIAKATGQP